MIKSILSLQSITKTFKQGLGQTTILKEVNYLFGQGRTYALTGASGAGKSTLLHIIAGLENPTSGIVSFNGTNLATLKGRSKELFFNKQIGLIFQSPYLINELTVLENVMVKGILGGIDYQECKKKAYLLIEQLGLLDKATSFPQLLSGGQQQRVAFARAILNEPAFLLADEPTGNLDEKTGRILIDLLHSYQQNYGMGLIISSHDQYVVGTMHEQLLLKDGYLIHDEGVQYDKRISNHPEQHTAR